MAITFTAADVRPKDGSFYPPRRGNVATGATVTPGQPVYINSSGDLDLGDGDDVNQSQCRGVALSDGFGSTSFAAGTRIDYVTYGPLSGFAGMTPGLPVYVSVTAGAYSHTASATTGDFNYIIGYAEDATTLFVNPQVVVPTAV
jgi:hypothetical protein